jgi:hypothetical protein
MTYIIIGKRFIRNKDMDMVVDRKALDELNKEYSSRKDISIIESAIFSYQGQGNPGKNDTVILINMSDRYGYQTESGFELYEFIDYPEANKEPYNLDKIKYIICDIDNRTELAR